MSFASRDDLAEKLQELNQHYEKYATILWRNGFRSFSDFTWAADTFYIAAGVEKAHMQDIRAWAAEGAAKEGGPEPDGRPVSAADFYAAIAQLKQNVIQDMTPVVNNRMEESKAHSSGANKSPQPKSSSNS